MQIDRFELFEQKEEELKELTVKFTKLKPHQYKELLKLFSAMNWLAAAGSSRAIHISVDGDGGYRAQAELPEKIQVTEKEERDLDNDKLWISLE